MNSWATWCDWYNANQAAADAFLDAWIVQGRQALLRLPPQIRAAVQAIAAQDAAASFTLAVKHGDCRGVDLWNRLGQLRSARSGSSSTKVKMLNMLPFNGTDITGTTAEASLSNCDAIIAAIEALEAGEWPGDVLPESLQAELESFVLERMPEWMSDAWEERNEEAIADMLEQLRAALEENCGSSDLVINSSSITQNPGSEALPSSGTSSSASSSSSSSSSASAGWGDALGWGAAALGAYAVARRWLPWLP